MRLRLPLIVPLLVAASQSAPAQSGSPHVVISQVYGGGGNTGATLRHDFVELFNRGAAPVDLTGWSVQYASATGAEWRVTPLAGAIVPGGYYLVRQAQGAGGSQDLPAPDAVGDTAMSATSAKVALVSHSMPLAGSAPAGAAIIDLIGYGQADFSETRAAPALTNTTAAIRRRGGCTDTDNNFADFETRAPAPRNGAAAANDCSAAPVPAETAAIHRIQGNGSTSPLSGQRVVTRGVVTARKSNGFFVQTADAEADADPATSEGLFVFTSVAPPMPAAPGNLVEVTGTVTEFRPASDSSGPTLTELTSPELALVSTGNPLPAPVTLTTALVAPTGGPDQLERLEGMRVRVTALRVTAPTGGAINDSTAAASGNGLFYGVLEGIPRPFREPGIPIADPLPPGAPAGVPRFDGNPELLRVDSDAQPGVEALEVTAGALVRNLTGPLDYGARAYTLIPDGGAPWEVSPAAAPAALFPPSADEFLLVSLNLRRLFDTSDDPAVSEPVLTAAAFESRLAKLSLAIRGRLMTPDVIAVQEVENLATLQALAARLNTDEVRAGRANPDYRAYLEEGNDPSGIDVGFLVKTSRVTVTGATQVGRDATYTTPDGRAATLHDRPPLVLRARAGDLSFTAIAVHLRSLINVEDAGVRAKRAAQAEALARLIQARRDADPAERLVVLGDFNAFPFNDGYVDVLGTVRGADLRNLVETLPREQSYSFLQDGSAQALDHILINFPMQERLSRFAVARINVDFPVAWAGDAARPERVSDHDVPVAYLFRSAAPPLTSAGITNAASFLGGAISPGEMISLFGSGIGPQELAGLELTPDGLFVAKELAGVRVLFDGISAPLLYAQARQVGAIVPYAIAGRATALVRLESGGRLVREVRLPVIATTPALFTLDASGAGAAAALNQDTTMNGPDNPAVRGEIVVLFASGAGQMTPAVADGRIGARPLARPLVPVSVTIDGQDAQVLYAGSAPDQVAGVLQMNVRVPAQARAGAVPVWFQVGGNTSQPGVTISVR